jgi:uncharacterized membrane protein
MTRPRSATLAACLLFLACCSLPWVGLWNPNGVADTGLYSLYGTRMAHGLVPYRDFFIEFPPGALVPLVLPALPGSHYVVWFKIFAALCGAGTIVCLAVILTRLRVTDRSAYLALGVAAVAPAALGAITLNSFDYWPALLITASVAALVADRPKTGFALLGIATAAKLFPAGLLAVALLFVLRRRGRGSARSALAAYLTAVAVAFLPFVILGPGGVRFSLRTQFGRGLQLESLGASILTAVHHLGAYEARYTPNLAYAQFAGSLASAIATVSTVVMLAAIVLVAWLYGRTAGGNDDFVNAAAATVVAIVAFAKVLSPQYLLWMVALVAAASVAQKAVIPLLLCILGLTQVWVPGRFRQLQDLDWVTWVLLARNLLLVGLFVSLAMHLHARRVAGERGAGRIFRRRADRAAPRAILLDRDRTA